MVWAHPEQLVGLKGVTPLHLSVVLPDELISTSKLSSGISSSRAMAARAVGSISSCWRVRVSAPGTAGTEMNQLAPALSTMTWYVGRSHPDEPANPMR